MATEALMRFTVRVETSDDPELMENAALDRLEAARWDFHNADDITVELILDGVVQR